MAKTNKSIHYEYILGNDEISNSVIDKMDIVIFYIYGDENEDEAKAFYYAREKKKQILEVCISMYRSGLLDI